MVGRAVPFFVFALGVLAWRLRRGDTPADFGLRQPRSWPRSLAVAAAGAALALIFPRLLSPLQSLLLPLMWVVAAFGEELLHRGFIMTRLAWIWGDTPAAWRRAVWVHAVFFGVIFLAAGRSLWAPVIAHGLRNTASFVVSYLG